MEANSVWKAAAIPPLTVVMIGHRRADLLQKAIESLERHSAPGCFELVLIINGGGEGGSRGVNELAEALLRRAAFPLAVVRIPECRPGAARNHGVRLARSPLLFFLDDDIECFQDVVSAALNIFADPAILAAGGANLTPPGSGALERATGGMMASRLGAASMRRRYTNLPEGPANEHGLILCNLAVRRAVFEGERGFAAHLISNEENVLLQGLEGKGGLLWSSPRLAVHHKRRDTWRGLASQAAKYGAGRAQNLLLVPETLRALYFLPLAFLAYLFLLPFLEAQLGPAAWAPFAGYLSLTCLHSVFLSLWRRDPAHLLGALVFPVVHLSYGVGFARALLLWGLRRKKLQEHTA